MTLKSTWWGVWGGGVCVGFALFFLSYWWIGSISASVFIGTIVGGGVIVLRQLSTRFQNGGA